LTAQAGKHNAVPMAAPLANPDMDCSNTKPQNAEQRIVAVIHLLNAPGMSDK
jgi:hypothetical protein